ncbi:MAG: 6-bladed beta-propeller [Clostridium sp.]|nr:6-bladed beta-propeller [Clostridium sp.]
MNAEVQGALIEINDSVSSFKRQDVSPVIIPIVEKQIYRTDSLFECFSYIPLETCEEGLVGNIKKICADENYLFVLDSDNQKIVQFDTDGRFVRTIGSRGRGPHEYTGVCDMTLDKKRRVICLLDAGAAKLLFYDYDGKCVKEEPMYYMFSEMAFIDTLRVYHVGRSHNEGVPAVDLFHLIISNDSQVPLFCDFPMSETHRRSFNFSLPNPLSESSDGVFYNTPLSDTL